MVEENCSEAALNFRLLQCTNFGKNSFQSYYRLVGKIEFEKWPLITSFQCIELYLTYLVSGRVRMVSCKNNSNQ